MSLTVKKQSEELQGASAQRLPAGVAVAARPVNKGE